MVLTVNVLLPLLSSLVSLVFAFLVFDQWRQRRRPFQLVWAVGLVFYACASATEVAGALTGWSSLLYRGWYLFGAFYVAAWLGLGTIYLLQKTGFGFFVGVMLPMGGLICFGAARAYPGSRPAATVMLAATVAFGAAILVATALHRALAAHITAAALVIGSVVVAILLATAALPAPGYALDPHTHVPVGTLIPGYLRVLTIPFNIAGALSLIHGAVWSAYIYMPKRKVLATGRVTTPVLAQLYFFVSVWVNLVASLPGAAVALVQGRLNPRVPATILIALGALVPTWTSGLNRFGITWAFFAGEFVGVLLIFAGFLVDGEVIQNVRVGAGTIWRRRPDGPRVLDERELTA